MKEFDLETFKELIDNVYDEIFIWDDNYTVIYANKASYRHYGLMPEEIIGKHLDDFQGQERIWTPTSVPYIYKEKTPVIQKQKTFLGIDIETISIPILDSNNKVKYVIQSCRDHSESLYKILSPIKMDSGSNNIADEEIIYSSKEMKEVVYYCIKICNTQSPILILGETGTGKSMLAKYIHKISQRKNKPFVYVNVASLNPSVIESEFFGYKKGSFTGANNEDKIGLFRAAGQGTIFLDEIGELSYSLQAKLLHVLQEKEFMPIGGVKPIKFEAHVICATNCDLQKMIEAGRFRNDLYHRLNVFEVTIPPLRKRKEDIKLFASYFLNIFNQKYNKSMIFSDKYLETIMKYPWKGNVRELSNVIERSVLVSKGKYIEISDIPDSFFSIEHSKYNHKVNCSNMTYDDMMREYEKKITENAFREYKTSRKVAEALGISQSTANRLRQKHLLSNTDI